MWLGNLADAINRTGYNYVYFNRIQTTQPEEMSMLLQAPKEEAVKLSPGDQRALVSAIIESLQNPPSTKPDCSGAIQRMCGLLKTDQPAPTDQEVAVMLEERRGEKYLQ